MIAKYKEKCICTNENVWNMHKWKWVRKSNIAYLSMEITFENTQSSSTRTHACLSLNEFWGKSEKNSHKWFNNWQIQSQKAAP